MANFEGVTSSSPGKIREEKMEELVGILEDHNIYPRPEISGDALYIHGYETLAIYDKEDDEDVTFEALEAIGNCLDGIMVIQCIGNEKCRFPLGAVEYAVSKDGVICNTFKDEYKPEDFKGTK